MLSIQFTKYVIVVGYGRYTTSIGGTDKVILAQQKICNHEGISYIYMYPVKKLNRFVKFGREDIWGIICDGKDNGLCYTDEFLNWIYKLKTDGYILSAIIIHHLKNVVISELERILDCVGGRIIFYLHDYMTICPARGLVNSQNQYCGATFPNYLKCSLCDGYNIERTEIVKNFICKYQNRTVFVAPSDVAKNEWLKAYTGFENKVEVIGHQKLIGKYNQNTEPIQDNEELKIGFVGYQSPLKGWEWWKEAISSAHHDKKKMRFFQFGKTNEHIEYVEEVAVGFQHNSVTMAEALRKEKIHCAVLWSVWPETYSYTYFEAWSSNAYIITNSLSGNIASQIEKNGNGIVASDETELKGILLDEENLRKRVNDYRRQGSVGPGALEDNDGILTLLSEKNPVIYDGNADEYKCSHHIKGEFLRLIYNIDAIRWHHVLRKVGK